MASLIRNAKIDGLGWRRGTLCTAKNGKIKPNFLRYNGQEYEAPNGKYEIRYYENGKAQHKPVGNDLDVALASLRAHEAQEKAREQMTALGLTQLTPDLKKALGLDENHDRPSLDNLRDSFIEKFARGSDDTVYAYTYVGTEFANLLQNRGKKFGDQIDEDDVLAFDRWLEAVGNGKSTRSGRYGYVRCFLRHAGLDPDKVVSKEWHIKLKKKPILAVETFEQEELDSLYTASSEYHRLCWRMYRMLGLRDEELAYLEWTNIDFTKRLCYVRFKPKGSYPWNPELEWKSKDSEERDIPIPTVLYNELVAWRERHPDSRWVMPTNWNGKVADQRPNTKLLKALKSDWRAAGLNCGHCHGCRTKDECNKAKLKTFRATYLTTMFEHVDNPKDVQVLAGHSSFVTTERYLKASKKERIQAACNAAFD